MSVRTTPADVQVTSRSPRAASRLALLALAGAAAAVVGAWFSRAALATALSDPGALVRWGLPVTTTLSELAGSLTLGALVLAAAILPHPAARRSTASSARPSTPLSTGASTGLSTTTSAERSTASGISSTASPAPSTAGSASSTAPQASSTARALTLAGAAAAVWTVLSVADLVLRYASVAGRRLDQATFGDELGVYVTQIDLGRTQLLVVVLAAVVTALALAVSTPTGAAWTAGLVVVAMWQQAQSGHAAGTASHDLATSSMFVHLVGAALWIGTLAALAVLANRLGEHVGPAVARYSVVAGWCFAAVAASGLVNAVVRLGGLDGLGTRYGVLVLVKVVLFAVLGLVGAAHRRAVLPRLASGTSSTSSTSGTAPASSTGTRPAAASRVSPTSSHRSTRALLWRLVAVELAVMGAVSGVAVALASTAPPVPDAPPTDPTPAEIVTGHPLPPEPTLLRWFTEWRWDLLFAAAAVAGLVVYVRWVVRLRRRGDAWPWHRTAAWVTGMVVFFWTTSGGPAMYGHVLFSAHMVQHMVLAMVVPILLTLAAPVTLALRALPARTATTRGDESRGPREWLLVLVHSHVGRFFAHPLVAAANFAGSMVVFYYSGAFEWALRSPVGHVAMVVHFSLAGYLFANALIGVDPGPSRPPYAQRILLLFATMAFHAFFGVALMSGEALLVADWFGLLGREWGPSALADQQRGGGVAWGIGELPTLALAIAVVVAWSRSEERAAKRRDRVVDRDGDTEMDEYNAMLARLGERDSRSG